MLPGRKSKLSDLNRIHHVTHAGRRRLQQKRKVKGQKRKMGKWKGKF